MKQEADKQFRLITIAQIRETLKNKSIDKYDKMIISEENPIKRANYVFVKFNYEKVEREVKKIRFPLYDAIKDDFSELEGGVDKFGEQHPVNSDYIFDTLKNIFKIKIESKKTELEKELKNNFIEPFDYPLDEIDGDINPKQKKYFIPYLTYQETCDECKGHKYVQCSNEECGGRHEYTCPICHGSRKTDCENCNKTGFIECDKCKGRGEYQCSKCDGKGEITCGGLFSSGCDGTGRTKDGQRCKKCNGRGYSRCSECRDGTINCSKCARKGEIRCEDCSGRGEVDCSYCSAKGRIICSTCYGDKEKYGMIDCPTCKTMGAIAQIVFVETSVSQNETEKIILKGEKLKITDENIYNHTNSNPSELLVYKKVNENVEEKYDDFSKEYAELFEKELALNKNSFPLVTKEEIFYQVIPCVELSYKHILTNTIHEFVIINFFDNPDIIFYNEPEQLKQDIKNVTKLIGGFFGNLFKTKNWKRKEDKKKETVLLIHLAKIDGKIEEQEKVYLSEMIGNLDDFTNSEKQKLFDIMNTSVLPELTKADVVFSSSDREQEAINKLTELANTDGEMGIAEKEFLEKIKNMITTNR